MRLVWKKNSTRALPLISGDEMRVSKALLVLAVLFLGGQPEAQQWVEYANLADRFAVNFPEEPKIEEIIYLSEYRAILPARVYTAQRELSYYSVTVVDYTNTAQLLVERCGRTGERCRRDDLPGDILGSIAYAAWNIRQKGGEVTYDSWAHYDRIPGHQLQITNNDETRTFVGIFLHASRLYIAEATVPGEALPPGLFQQSLRVLDGEGKVVRYEFYVDEDGEVKKNRVDSRVQWSGNPPRATRTSD